MRLWNCLAVVAEAFNVKLDRLTNELFCLIATLADCDTPRQIRYVRSHATSCFFEDDQVFHAFAILSSKQLASGTSRLAFPATVTVQDRKSLVCSEKLRKQTFRLPKTFFGKRDRFRFPHRIRD